MLSYSEIFNIQKTTLPISKKDFANLLSKTAFIGYVQCSYDKLIQTVKEICSAETYQVSVNPDTLYAAGNNPFHKADVVFKIEGLRDHSEFIDGVIATNDTKEWTDFISYSETFKDEIRNLKSKVIQKILWTRENMNNWFEDKSVLLMQDKKDELTTDYDKFREYVLMSSDLYGFIDSCSEASLDKATKVLIKNLNSILTKYKYELQNHINNKTKNEEYITVKNPIINRIFIVSTFASQCRKDWPRIKFTSLDKRSFDSISLWEE